jgi:glycerol-3-phosphate cytidylyltransferase
MIVYTGGTFDVPHMGHVYFFKTIKVLFPYCNLVVSLNRDEFIERYKGKKPLFSYDDRKRFLESIEYIDEVVENEGDEDSKITISKVNPDVIVIGNDWLMKDYCKQMGFDSNWLSERGIVLAYFPHLKGLSATIIKGKLDETRGYNSNIVQR